MQDAGEMQESEGADDQESQVFQSLSLIAVNFNLISAILLKCCLQEVDQDNVSVTSEEAEPSLCGRCEDADNVLGHLEDSVPCREATMRELLPREWWMERYFDDTDLLLLDLSVAKSCCLNTGGCPLPNGVIERYSRHPFNDEKCLHFYKTAPIFAQLNVNVGDTAALKKFLKDKKGIINRAKAKENETFQEMMASQMKDICRKCTLLGPVLSNFELRSEVSGSQRNVCVKPVCEDEDNLVDCHPRTLAFDRGNASRSNGPGHKDHLVAFHVPGKASCVLGPAQLIPENLCLPPDGRIEGEECIVILVPTTMQAMGKDKLGNPSVRAAEEFSNLTRIADATLAPRTMFLSNFSELVQAASTLHRKLMAAFRKCCNDQISSLRNSKTARGSLERSPYKTNATFRRSSFSDVAPRAVKENYLWSDFAEGARFVESGARSAVNGRIKTKVRVRLLTDNPALWSDKLKSIIVLSFERDVRLGEGRALELACEGGCNQEPCPENHLNVDTFLQERFTGLRRLQRITLVVNYLKAMVESIERKVIVPECDHYNFKIEWDRDTWNVHMVGHMWMSRRRSLNEKLARNWYQGDVSIVRRILQQPKDLETVSLDPGHLEER